MINKAPRFHTKEQVLMFIKNGINYSYGAIQDLARQLETCKSPKKKLRIESKIQKWLASNLELGKMYRGHLEEQKAKEAESLAQEGEGSSEEQSRDTQSDI